MRLGLSPTGEKSLVMKQTAQRTALATLVVIGLVAATLALWKLKLVISLVFLGIILAAAMRGGIDALHRRGVPRGIGLALHYIVFAALIGLFLWLVVPRAIDQVQNALGGTTKAQIHHEATHSKGIKHEVLTAIDLPSVRSRGYAFQVELTYRALVRGFRVVEVPIVFRDRVRGTSKMSWRITAEAAWLVPQLRRSAAAVRHPAADAQARSSPRRSDTG